MSTEVVPLRLVDTDAVTQEEARPALAFTFTRRRNGCDVGIKRLTDRSWSWLATRSDKAAAREWARQHAAQQGFPYAETAMQDQDPTPAEMRTIKANSAASSVGWADSEAEAHENAEEFREAAEMWIRAARRCEEYAAFVPGSEAKIGRAAASRIGMAVLCLGRYRARLLAMQDGSSLREVATALERDLRSEAMVIP